MDLSVQHPQIQKESQYIKYLCCDDAWTMTLWMTGIRIAKVASDELQVLTLRFIEFRCFIVMVRLFFSTAPRCTKTTKLRRRRQLSAPPCGQTAALHPAPVLQRRHQPSKVGQHAVLSPFLIWDTASLGCFTFLCLLQPKHRARPTDMLQNHKLDLLTR